MKLLRGVCRAIDATNLAVGQAAAWLVLMAVVVSSVNATIRYALDRSSNAWLELQWYLFGAVFLLCSGYTLLRNEHIRIDILSSRLSPRGKAWLDLLGGVFFLLPVSVLIGVLSWPGFINSIESGEMSSDAGGLIRWPARLLIPVGFLLLSLQGVSEVLKRVLFLAGAGPDPGFKPTHAPLGVPDAEALPETRGHATGGQAGRGA